MSADIDIDFANRDDILKIIKHVPASQAHDGHTRRHNSGVYVTDVPVDPMAGYAAIDYQEAETRGYFKIDFLNVSVYQLIKSPEHYQEMLSREPPWHRLDDREFCEKIVHINNHYDVLRRMPEPVDSIPRMAAFISIIRPGKAHLQGRPWSEVFDTVWNGDDSQGYTFKKSHSLSYAVLVGLHMNLIDLADQGN